MDAHHRAHESRELWQNLEIGQDLSVVKINPDGDEAARYAAVVVARAPEDDWVALRAFWTYPRVEIDGLVFDPGDELIEWFSPWLPFNAFGVLSPEGELRGWYANVTYPAYLESKPDAGSPPTLVWHDLYLDLVGLPDETFVTRDEDELAESGLASSHPGLHREILAAADELIRRYTFRKLPFLLLNTTTNPEFDPRQSQNESV
ncbi:MAG: DUF402 domain-containing protein [Chloroflexota bacterium]|nr:DUF402 domain-containing protein [Chloroflexota bacterium]